MSYTRWLCFTTGLTLLFTSGGLWLEARLKGEPAAVAHSRTLTQENTQATIQVLITGAVAKPGLYRLPDGSPVQTLLDLAGGATPEARLSALDLNRALRPGEVLNLPGSGEASADSDAASPDRVTDRTAGKRDEASDKPAEKTRTRRKGAKSSSHTSSQQSKGPISINRASAQDFERLPGVGPALAKRMVEWRRAHGGFKTIEDLLEVKGIGAKKLAKMRDELSL